MASAFVAGATGYTGREVVRILATRGVTTIAHVRPDSRELEQWRERFAAMGAQTDITPWDSDALAATFRRLGVDCVFALLGTTRVRMQAEKRTSGKNADYDAVDYGLTALLIDAAARQEGTRPTFVYLSAAGVERFGTSNAYYAARVKAERKLRESGVPYVIARPGLISGPDRRESRPSERAIARLLDCALGVAGALGARRVRDTYRSISGVQLGAALVALALDTQARNVVAGPAELRRRSQTASSSR
jgi:nucleoside-diphosphate-sugar epimerase